MNTNLNLEKVSRDTKSSIGCGCCYATATVTLERKATIATAVKAAKQLVYFGGQFTRVACEHSSSRLTRQGEQVNMCGISLFFSD
jgi:hydroxymethylpyrimidine/phosphomethylpyrimidine kinase